MSSFSITDVTTTSFTVTFSDTCSLQLPSGAGGYSAAGCFAFRNLTGSEWTGINLSTSYPPLDGGYTCSATPTLFSNVACGPSGPNLYVISFTDGGIPDQTNSPSLSYYVISESDIQANLLTFDATVTLASAGSVTPEPSAIVLLGTGLLCAGAMMWTRRRVQV